MVCNLCFTLKKKLDSYAGDRRRQSKSQGLYLKRLEAEIQITVSKLLGSKINRGKALKTKKAREYLRNRVRQCQQAESETSTQQQKLGPQIQDLTRLGSGVAGTSSPSSVLADPS